MTTRLLTAARVAAIALAMTSNLSAQQTASPRTLLAQPEAVPLLQPVQVPAVSTPKQSSTTHYNAQSGGDFPTAQKSIRQSRLPVMRNRHDSTANRAEHSIDSSNLPVASSTEVSRQSRTVTNDSPQVREANVYNANTIDDEPVGRASIVDLNSIDERSVQQVSQQMSPTSRLPEPSDRSIMQDDPNQIVASSSNASPATTFPAVIAATAVELPPSPPSNDSTLQSEWVPARVSRLPNRSQVNSVPTVDAESEVMPTHVAHSNATRVEVRDFSLPPLPPALVDDAADLITWPTPPAKSLAATSVSSLELTVVEAHPAINGEIEIAQTPLAETTPRNSLTDVDNEYPVIVDEAYFDLSTAVSNLFPTEPPTLVLWETTEAELAVEEATKNEKPALPTLTDKQRTRLERLHRTLHTSVDTVSLTRGMAPPVAPDNLAAAMQPEIEPQWIFGAGWVHQPPVRYSVPFAHRPLYFEDAPLERCGTTIGVSQTFVSAVHFLGNCVFLPFHMMCEDPYSTYLTTGDCKTCR